MYLAQLVAAALTSAACVADASVRGVAPDDQHLYAPDKDGMFSCLTDPSIRIPMDRVNDDYCDCPDGSDEPGTAACSNGKFWCKGSNGYIPSRLVGDGVCDYDVCCDGSDEAPGVCQDKCAEVKAKQEAERRAHLAYLAEGSRLRSELVEKATARKKELVRSVDEFQKSIPRLVKDVEAAGKDVTAAEETDALSGADAESVSALGQLREALQEGDKAHEQLVNQFYALKDAYLELYKAMETMSVDYNPNFNDPAVKDAIRKWRTAAKPELSLSGTRDLQADMELFDKVKIAGSESPVVQGWRALLPAPLRSVLPGRSTGGGSSGPRAQAAKERFDTLTAALEESQTVLNLQTKLLSLGSEFWGEDEVGRSSEDLCVSKRKGDFDYEACLFGTSVQIDGRYTVQLGRSTGLKHADSGYVIDFVDGDVCPNGIGRSTTMLLQCGHTTEALSVEEPETCHYVMRVSSPLVCGNFESEVAHDEL